VTVLGDRDALKQVFVILFDNALKYAPGPITVTIRAVNGAVHTSVIDTGPGIEPTLLPHIFERFYRGDAARTGASAGLGLAIARALVEAQGGSITVESQPNQGSVFTVILPEASATAIFQG
jgi:signal transduction histidine kinase